MAILLGQTGMHVKCAYHEDGCKFSVKFEDSFEEVEKLLRDHEHNDCKYKCKECFFHCKSCDKFIIGRDKNHTKYCDSND
jgi:hypothetical protein